MRESGERTVGSRLRTNSFTQRSVGRASARSTSVSAITAQAMNSTQNGQILVRLSAYASQNNEGNIRHNPLSGGEAKQKRHAWLVRTVDWRKFEKWLLSQTHSRFVETLSEHQDAKNKAAGQN
jgi:hypothetical protein